MQLSSHDRLFVLTGAGISVESGLAAFRGNGGLWNGFRTDEVATPEAWAANPTLVWQFYSHRRRDALGAVPNPAHTALARLEDRLGDRFFLCTQNVDSLHELAGSRRVHHMHGSLATSRCTGCGRTFPDEALYFTAAELPACNACGAPVRPDIVWFGETPLQLDHIFEQLTRADVLLVVGTSGSVYPAAGFVHLARTRGLRTVYVGPEAPLNAGAFDEVVLGNAVAALPPLLAGLPTQG